MWPWYALYNNNIIVPIKNIKGLNIPRLDMSKDTLTTTIEEFLQRKGIDVTEKLKQVLGKLGVKKISHLSLFEEKDFREAGKFIILNHNYHYHV